MSEIYLFAIGFVLTTAVAGTVWRIGDIEKRAIENMRSETEKQRKRHRGAAQHAA